MQVTLDAAVPALNLATRQGNVRNCVIDALREAMLANTPAIGNVQPPPPGAMREIAFPLIGYGELGYGLDLVTEIIMRDTLPVWLELCLGLILLL